MTPRRASLVNQDIAGKQESVTGTGWVFAIVLLVGLRGVADDLLAIRHPSSAVVNYSFRGTDIPVSWIVSATVPFRVNG